MAFCKNVLFVALLAPALAIGCGDSAPTAPQPNKGGDGSAGAKTAGAGDGKAGAVNMGKGNKKPPPQLPGAPNSP